MKKWFMLLMLIPVLIFAQSQQVDLFFSEYIEGSSSNKALEIYNPTDTVVYLDSYMMKGTANNASTWEYEYFFPAGDSILPGDVYVIVDDAADPAMQAVADWVTTGFEVGFNGNDARGLFKIVGQDTILLDVVGDPNNPNGVDYDCAGVTGATKDHTLIRKPTVVTGNPDWTSSAGTDAASSEWIVNNIDDFSDLGQHTYTPNASLPPIIDNATVTYAPFTPGVQTIYAKVTDDGTVTEVFLHYYMVINDQFPTQVGDTVTVAMTQAVGDSFSVDVDLSNLNNGDGFVYWITAVDDQVMTDTSNVFKVLIGTTPLSKAHLFDANNAQMYNGFLVKASGVVTVSNGLLSSRYFFFQDTTAGIKVYDGGSFGNLQVLVGDSIDIVGEIDEFSSESEIVNYQSVNVLKSGVSVQPAVITTASIGETYEGRLITIQNLDTVAGGLTTWSAGSFNLDMADDDGPVTVRIASDSLANMPEPDWPADITGVLTLYQSNYQLMPRFVEDISTLPALGIEDNANTISKFEVYQNYPNPFNPSTTIRFNLPKVAKVKLVIFNSLGQVVKSVDINGKAGINTVQFDASNLSTGIYFYQVSYNNQHVTRKMLLVK
jgi:hypothetical protein